MIVTLLVNLQNNIVFPANSWNNGIGEVTQLLCIEHFADQIAIQGRKFVADHETE